MHGDHITLDNHTLHRQIDFVQYKISLSRQSNRCYSSWRGAVLLLVSFLFFFCICGVVIVFSQLICISLRLDGELVFVVCWPQQPFCRYLFKRQRHQNCKANTKKLTTTTKKKQYAAFVLDDLSKSVSFSSVSSRAVFLCDIIVVVVVVIFV